MGMRSSLFIANVNGAQGLYTCKATNNYGSEMSSPSELKIKGKTFFFNGCLNGQCKMQTVHCRPGVKCRLRVKYNIINKKRVTRMK